MNKFNYNYDEKLGEGGYSTVYKSTNKGNFAIKVIKINSFRGIPFTTLREIRMLQLISHKNLCEMKEYYIDNNKLKMVMPYYQHDFGKIISSGVELSDKTILYVINEALKGLEYLHKRNIIHRDVKPHNIFISSVGEVKLGDFGMSKEKHELMTVNIVTLSYRAPELIFGRNNYDESIDIWGMGCVLYEAIFKKHLFDAAHELVVGMQMIHKFGLDRFKHENIKIFTDCKHVYPVNDNFFHKIFNMHPIFESSIIKDIFIHMLATLPDERYSANTLLKEIKKLYDFQKMNYKVNFKYFLFDNNFK